MSPIDIWNRIEDGQLREPAGADDAAEAMIDQLRWWGRVLRDARVAAPYLH